MGVKYFGGMFCAPLQAKYRKGLRYSVQDNTKEATQLINTWGLKMHNCTSLSAAPVSLEEFRENTRGWAISEDTPCEQLLVLSIANCDATIGEK